MKISHTIFAHAAGFALGLLTAGAVPATAQEPDYEFADVLAPYYDAAPQEDILDLKLGMTVREANLALLDKGFHLKGTSLGRTARGAGNMRYLEAEREHEGTRPTYERITVYFDFSENPRALAIYRSSSYRRDHYPNYATVMSALLDKATQVLAPEKLWVNPDCGLKTRGWAEVEPALRRMVEAARQLRRTHAR